MKLFSATFLLLLLAGCASGPRIDTSHSSIGHDSRVQFIVLHYTSTDLPRSLELLSGRDVSSHYLIGESPATIYRLVDEDRRAWHAGESEWNGRTWLNATSIGIELVNQGYEQSADGRRLWYPYSQAQIDALVVLLKDIMARHGLKPGAIIGHSDIAPQRKVDPGPLFPWKALAGAGIGRWYDEAGAAAHLARLQAQGVPDVAWFQQQLQRLGYACPQDGVLDKATINTLAAFQMHYRPALYDGQPDAETAAIMLAML